MADILTEARRVLDNEAQALVAVSQALGETMTELIEDLVSVQGTIVLVGMGKSGFIARKIVATLVSTGSRAVFLHPSEALHGDLGILTGDDYVIALSHSGETRDILGLIPHLRRSQVKVAAITGGARSTLVKLSDLAVVYPMESEACPLELAPMTSTTIMLALGDAIASCLMVQKKFTRENFGQFHPSGSLGKELVAEVQDVMITDDLPICTPSTPLKDLLGAMVSSNVGAMLITSDGQASQLLGIISDGDIKRILNKYNNLDAPLTAADIMTARPVTIEPQAKLGRAVSLMQDKSIYLLPVITQDGRVKGIVRMHEILAYNP